MNTSDPRIDLAGQRVLVVGLGKTGMAVVRLLRERGARVIANDARGADALAAEADALGAAGVELALGGHEAELFTKVDRIVVSPGVPPLPALDAAAAAGVPIASEVEVASWFIDATLIGVTGTNGKSTVTTLVGEMCKLSGRPTFVGGNLGTPLVDAVGTPAAARGGYAVVELSSFQLERVEHLHVHAAALLNITEDHLDRYPSFAAYAAAKANIFRGQREDDAAVVRDGDAVCTKLARQGRARVRFFGGDGGETHIAGDRLMDVRSGLALPVAEIPLTGAYNLDNACAAALLARLVGVAPEHVATALRAFRGLPHRMAHVRDLDGVAYYDDSKATNVGATVAALDGLAQRNGRVVLIAGGRDKGGDYAPLVERMARIGRATVLIGEAAGKIRAALETCDLALDAAGSMEDAVARARTHAKPGDVVLLAPACASYDMFTSYAERGDVFQRAVRALEGGAG